MKTILRTAILGVFCLLLIGAPGVAFMAEATTDQAEPTAEEIIAAATNLLERLPQFSFEADITEDVLTDGDVLIQTAHHMTYAAKRPNKLYYRIEGDDINKEWHYDGKTVTVYDLEQKFYASTAFPSTIDEALNKARDEYNIRMSIIGMARSNLYAVLTEKTKDVRVIGVSRVNGHDCYQLLLERERVNIQLWIQTGKTNLLRKMLITYKQDPGSPQWSAVFTHWNTNPGLADSRFDFKPPQGSVPVKFLKNAQTVE